MDQTKHEHDFKLVKIGYPRLDIVQLDYVCECGATQIRVRFTRPGTGGLFHGQS